ncbi:hypothetical protein ACHAWF_018815 [Thalassiosira exigua]
MPAPASAPGAAPPTPASAPSASASEDAARDGGDAIDTFSSYVPAALPPCVVAALRARASGGAASKPGDGVIEILDDDADDARTGTNNDGDDANATSPGSAVPCHTSPAVESALLSSVSAPPAPDEAAASILKPVREGKLSPLQAEGAALAVRRFNRVYTSKGTGRNDASTRAGFFIGDGAGIGKGRQISAVLLDALSRNHGGGRHLWLSVSRELVQDARRDLADVGCHVDVHDGADMLDRMQGGRKGKALGAGGTLGKGVLFVTYSLLVSGQRVEDIVGWLAGRNAAKALEKVRERTRIEQSYTGVIIFDEAHKAKNLEADTRTAKLVIALQERLPNARVLYCSATGVSDIKHMAYATRLGLWGSANPLYPTFDSFREALAKRGVGAMEMLALEMKRKGIFLARTLSWDGAEFHTLEVKLNTNQIAMYDGAVQWWFDVKDSIDSALELMGIAAPRLLWRAYWSAHQRFFREMCICAKIDEVVKQAKEYLENDHAIVIGLQSTGEASMEVALDELADLAKGAGKSVNGIDFEDMTLSGLVSTSASIMSNFIRNHFPVALPPPKPPKIPDIPPNGFPTEAHRLEHMRLLDLAERMKTEPPPLPIPQLLERRQEILDSIRDLELPPNPLDEIIDRLGGEGVVAEMTGRSGRILRNKSGKYKYVSRRVGGPSKQKSYGLSMPSREDENDRLNIVEKKKFMDGTKSVAIISDAASTGISLHADRRCPSSHKRRVHASNQLPWAADKAIQQLGRSHRSGQETAPIYKMVVTELGGERRFASAVSKRMAQLGALTKGDRRAASGSDLSEFDIDSLFGRRALVIMVDALSNPPVTAPSRNSNGILDKFVAAKQLTGKDEEEKRSFALTEAAKALTEVGLVGDPSVVSQSCTDVTFSGSFVFFCLLAFSTHLSLQKQFLNRIAGLDVARQNLLFSLFMATLDDVIAGAKATGEFEGSVEDVKASKIMLKGKPKVIATDTSCGAKTKLTKLTVDRGISFDSIVQAITDGDKNGSHGTNKKVGLSGFYLSKRKIAGRRLVLFAQKKVEREDDTDTDFIDPQNLMIITRPNTVSAVASYQLLFCLPCCPCTYYCFDQYKQGKNPCEMPSRELEHKYELLLSYSDLLGHLSEVKKVESDVDAVKKCAENLAQRQDAASIIRSKWGTRVADLWDDAYDNSNFSFHNDGLAPRISEMALLTGAVLHILPSLEKAVQFMPGNQRSLRVMRIELSGSGQKIVGIKYPSSKEAIDRLMMVMNDLANARQGVSSVPSFLDETYSAIDEKAVARATTERKTMKR